MEWMENAKRKTKKKSKTSLACQSLFENHVYDEQLHFLADLFVKAMKDSSDDISNFVVPPFDIPCFTEIKVVDGTFSQIYRGHPAY